MTRNWTPNSSAETSRLFCKPGTDGIAPIGNRCPDFNLTEMNGGNIRLRMTLKIDVGCLSLASEINGVNIRLRITLKINVGCVSLASEMNGGNIRRRMTLEINVGCLSLASEMNGANTFGSV